MFKYNFQIIFLIHFIVSILADPVVFLLSSDHQHQEDWGWMSAGGGIVPSSSPTVCEVCWYLSNRMVWYISHNYWRSLSSMCFSLYHSRVERSWSLARVRVWSWIVDRILTPGSFLYIVTSLVMWLRCDTDVTHKYVGISTMSTRIFFRYFGTSQRIYKVWASWWELVEERCC